MKSVLYTLHYIHMTYNYGITFTSDNIAPMHLHIHYPPSTDVEPYTDTIPPKLSTTHTISAYSNPCWGSQMAMQSWKALFYFSSSFALWTVALFSRMVAPLGGLENVRNGPLLACVKLRLGQLMLHWRRLWTFGTSHTVSLRMATLLTISLLPLFWTTTTMLVWSGCTIWLLKQLTTSSFAKFLSMNGYRTTLSIWFTSLEKLTQLKYSPKRRKTALTSIIWWTLSWFVYLISWMILS